MTNLTKEFRTGQTVFVIDPDLKEPTVSEAQYVRADKDSGQHLVVLEHEDDAVRRIQDKDVNACASALNIRLGL